MKLFLPAILIILCLTTSLAKEITLAWDANLAEEKVVEYRLYAKTATGEPVQIWKGAETTTKVAVKTERTTYTVTAVNDIGLESLPSNPVSDRPSPPQAIKLTIVASASLNGPWEPVAVLHNVNTGDDKRFFNLRLEKQ